MCSEYGNGTVLKEGEVHRDGHGVVVVVAAADSEGGVDGEEAVVKRCPQRILMLIWRSITQKQCR